MSLRTPTNQWRVHSSGTVNGSHKLVSTVHNIRFHFKTLRGKTNTIAISSRNQGTNIRQEQQSNQVCFRHSHTLITSNTDCHRTWTCDITGCTSNAQFTRLADLQRHQSTVHGMGTPEFPCTVPRCSRVGDKGFTRRDHLIEHLRSFHQLDIPKRKPGERSAFPFGWPEGYQSASGSKSR